MFLGLDEAGHLEALWSRRILNETHAALVTKIGLSNDGASRLTSAIATAFARREVVLASDLPSLPTAPDPDDHHVLAGAVIGEADAIVTHDLRGFRMPPR